MIRTALSPLARRAAAVLLALAATAGAARAADYVLSGRIGAFAMRQHSIYVGHETEVVVDGDNTTDLDCWLFNPDGHLVSRDIDYTDYCILDAPDYGTHRLVIRNLGSVYNDYVITKR